MDKLQRLAEAPVSRLLWEYSAPAVVGMIVTSLYNIIDRIFIGQGVGPEAIAGLAITFPVMNISAALGVLIGAGASARTSISLGADDHRRAVQILGNSLTLTLIIGTAYILAFAYYLDDILLAFGAGEATLPYAHDFMLWILPGMFLTNLCFNLNNIMRASGYPIRAMFTMIIGAVCNVILAPIFIFALDLGIKGAAIATDISMAISTVFVICHFFRKDSIVRFTRGTYRLNRGVVFGIVSIGMAPSVVNVAGCLILITVNNSLKQYGSDLDIGAAGIFTTFTNFFVTFIIGIGLGMQPIVGYNYGCGRLLRLWRTYRIAVIWGTVFSAGGCLFGLTFPRYVAMAFTTDERLISITVTGMTHALLMFWMVGFQVISTSFFQSVGKAGKAIVLSLCRQIIFLYPLLRLLPPRYGIDSVWYSFPISDALATVVTLVLIIWQLRQIRYENSLRVRS